MEKKVKHFLNQLHNKAGQQDFLLTACRIYRDIMNFQHIHFCNIHRDGNFSFEEHDGLLDTEKYLYYLEQEISIQNKKNIKINAIRNLSINESKLELFLNKSEFYNWIYEKQGVREIHATFHPCRTVFVCMKINKSGLNAEEQKIHKYASEEIIKLFYLHKQLIRNQILEEILSLKSEGLLNKPVMILDSNLNPVFKDKGFSSFLETHSLEQTELIHNRKSVIYKNISEIKKLGGREKIIILSKNIKIHIQAFNCRGIIKPYYQCTLTASNDEDIQFTKRETEIFELIKQGLKNREISEILYIDETTVKKHISNMMSKTNCRNRIELLNCSPRFKNSIQQ